MKRLLIFTTENDLSESLFSTPEIKKKIKIDFCYYNEQDSKILDLLQEHYDFIYLRDPFTDEMDYQEIKSKIKLILDNKGNSYLVDKISKIEDIFLEDKWMQYHILNKFMPKTFLLSSENKNKKRFICKKRISSRAKGIFFDCPIVEEHYKDYIMQERLNIDSEYRIYSIFGKIMKTIAVRSSKTESQKIKVIGSEQISKSLLDFVKKVQESLNFDFIGIDIAKTKEGQYVLLEINRSCLFNGLYRVTGINLAEEFIDSLLQD